MMPNSVPRVMGKVEGLLMNDFPLGDIIINHCNEMAVVRDVRTRGHE